MDHSHIVKSSLFFFPGHVMHIFLALTIFLFVYFFNTLKLQSFHKITEKFILIDEELFRVGHPVVNIIDLKVALNFQRKLITASIASFGFLIIYDHVVFYE